MKLQHNSWFFFNFRQVGLTMLKLSCILVQIVKMALKVRNTVNCTNKLSIALLKASLIFRPPLLTQNFQTRNFDPLDPNILSLIINSQRCPSCASRLRTPGCRFWRASPSCQSVKVVVPCPRERSSLRRKSAFLSRPESAADSPNPLGSASTGNTIHWLRTLIFKNL